MEAIDHFNLRSFDLNLLVAFDAVMQDRSITRAAKRLKIGQPAMSHNLATLRMLFRDELFVRVRQTMHPTPLALALEGPVRSLLSQAQSVLQTREVFRPEQEVRTFRIGVSSELELLLLPPLAAHLRAVAPGIRIQGCTAAPDDVDAMLDAGTLDVAVGCTHRGATRFRCETLFDAEVLCCFNPSLLGLDVPVSRSAYLAARHVVVSQSGSLHGCIEDALRHVGVDIDVVAAAPNFLTVLATAAQAPVLATLAGRIAHQYAPALGLAISPVPLPLSFPPVTMVWPAVSENEPGRAWLRDQIRHVVRPGTAEPPPSGVARPATGARGAPRPVA